MKKLFALLLALIMVLSMVACGAKKEEAPAADAPAADAPAADAPATEPAHPEEPSTEATVEEETGKITGPGVYGGVFNVRLTADVVSFDPCFATQTASLVPMFHIYESVISMDSKGNFYPQVCEFEMNEDSTELKLTVREDVKFHDGSEVTSADIAASVDRWTRHVTKYNAGFGDRVESVEIVDDKTVVYKFSSGAPLALYYLANYNLGCYVMQASVIEALGEEGQLEGFDPATYIGTGPYTFTEWVPGQYSLVTRYEDYVPQVNEGADGLAATRFAYPDQIKFIPMADQTTGAMALMAGELDYGFSLSAELKQTVLDAGAAYGHRADMGYTPLIVLNNSEAKAGTIIQNHDFRMAVLLALDPYEMTYAVVTDDSRVDLNATPVTSGSTYDNTVGDDLWLESNMEEAAKYLEASGYNGETLKWITRTNSDNKNSSIVAVEKLAELGINIELEVIEATAAANYQADQTGWDFCQLGSPTVCPEPTAWAPLAPGYFAGWENEERDAQWEILTGSGVYEERQAAFDRIIELMYEDIPFIMAGTYRSEYFYRVGVEGTYQGQMYYFWNSYKTN